MIHAKTPLLFVAMLLAGCLPTSLLQAQTQAQTQDSTNASTVADGTLPPDDATDPNAEAEEEPTRYIFNLGDFKINDLRPTRNVTAKLKFELHLTFTKSLTESQIEQLENWKHRLRDQVITTVRVTEMKYFHEPDLAMLSRTILIRVNRLFKAKLAEEVLFTKYMFRTH